ncbi:Di-copper centre-containing protein [Melanomma pulvis-pyrius CBS 109.77]|uniref:Di-copper centre-containing protein n=1 Tax=Melanomma pulvis-pyrius CBS 109.77 TaxID=1314802 RepID=A0A6A6X7P0_9PLEO|nr:Di-copper centre-containing protein [Melanomma pulvis-pyrius CBS 109.77]
MKKLVKEYIRNTKKGLPSNGACTADKIAVRKEWGNLNTQSRREYINAVKCLHALPSKIDPAKAPGARSRFDDFEAAHIINTRLIHGTGLFFAWHRYFVQLFETALREECGYSGYQPYWDWSKYADLPFKSNPLYDGSATSISGNGRYIPDRNGTLQPFPIPVENPPAIYVDPGTGGGYIYEGPFVDWKLHLGPVVHMNVRNGQPVNPNPRPDGLGYNPRHIIRDFNNTLLQQSASYSNLTSMLVNMTSIHTFHPAFFTGPHLAGHTFISAYDNDLFTSPGDPLFWFHHTQVDRIWTIWQGLDFSTREYALDGTITIINVPPSRNATLNDTMDFEISPDIPIEAALSPTKNGLCYIYE